MSGAPLEDWQQEALGAIGSDGGGADAPATGLADWQQEALDALTPPGTVRRGVAGELGASFVRGGLNLANVPYNTGAALTGGVASIYAPRAERTQWEQGQAPQSDRQVLAGRIDTQIRDLQNQLGVLAQPPQSLDAMVNNPQAMQRFMATRALTPDQTSAQRASILQRIANLENQKRQYTELNPLEAASVGFAQTAQGVQGAIDRAVPPTAQAVTGERPWYSPTNIASVTLENAPQIIAQLALTRGMGGLGVGGTAAARFAASGVPIQLSQAMETQNNARLLPGQSPTAQADAVQAGAPYAVLDASLNAVIERLTAKGLIGTDEASQAAARMTLRQRAVGAMRAAPLAGATGAAQETGQEFTSAAVEAGSVNPDAMNADKLLPRLALAGITGGLLEGPLGAASQFTSTGLPSGSTNANASGLDPLPRAPARLDPRMGQAQAVGAPDGQGGVVNPQPNPARLEPGPINAADAAQTPGDVPQGAEGSPGADQAGGPGIDLAAVEAAGRQDAADNLEPEQLPEGTDQAVVDAYTRGYTNGQTTTAQAAPLEDAGTVQLAANERGPAGIDPGSVQEGGVLGDGQGVPDRGGAGAGPVADAGRADVAPGTGSGVDEQSATENPAPRPENADFGLSRRNGATEDAPVRTPEQQTVPVEQSEEDRQKDNEDWRQKINRRGVERVESAEREKARQQLEQVAYGKSLDGGNPAKTPKPSGPLKAWEKTEDQYVREESAKTIARYEHAIESGTAEVAAKTKTPYKRRQQLLASIPVWQRKLEAMRGAAGDVGSAEWKDLREQYRATIKKAISSGQSVPAEIVASSPEFQKAVTSRARYDKGRKTSFGNQTEAVNDSMQLERGFKVKRQDGTEITDQEIKNIKAAVSEVEEAIGSLTDAMRTTNLTIAHTRGKFPFMDGSAGGLYHPGERTVTYGTVIGPFKIRALAHEMGHWLDYEGGRAIGGQSDARSKQGVLLSRGKGITSLAEAVLRGNKVTDAVLSEDRKLIGEATRTMHDPWKAAQLARKNAAKIEDQTEKDQVRAEQFKLTPYWREPREIWARLFEQYVATKRGKSGESHESPERYEQAPAWWSKEQFAKFMPDLERAIQRRMEALQTEAIPASWAERQAAKLEAQAAELTKGPSRLPGNKRGSRSGATTLPAELVALAYRTAARVLRTADRSVASIKSALETLIAQDGKTYTDAEKRGVIRSALRVVRRLDTEQPKKNERKTVTKMLEEVVKGKSQAPTELQREGIRRVSEAVALARADEKAKGLGVIERYDKARKSIRKAIEDNLPPSERGRFLAMLDNAKTPLQVARGMRRVAAAAVSLDARALMKSVDSMSGVMELRKLSAERRAEADDLLAQAEALRPAVGRPDAEDPSKMQAMAAAAKTLKGIDHELAFLYADQKAADKTFAADKRRTAAEHAKVFIDNISAVKDADPRGSGKAGASKQGVFDIFTFTDFEGMTSALEGKSAEESVLASKWNQMRQRDLERADQALEIRQKLDEAAKAGGYKSLSDAMEKAAGQLGMASAQTHLVKLGGKEVRLTVDELMQVYADLMDTSTRALYAGGMGVVQTENAGGSKIKATLDELIEATNKLTPAQKKAADAVGVVIRSLGPDISRVHKELTGRGIDLTPDYNPRRRARETTDAPKDPPSGWAGVRGAMLENSPFTQEREGGTERARVLGGLFRDAIDYADNATRMIHLAGPVRELYAITGSGPVREALADRYGEVANKRLDQFIAAAAGTTRTTVTGAGEVIAGLNSLMASANLTLRPTTLAMNSASVIRLAPVMDPKTYADGLAGAKDVSAADINRVGYFAERFNTDPGARASGIGEAGNVSAQSRASVRRALLASLRSASRADLKDAWGAYRRAMGSIPLMNMAEMIPAKVAYAGYLAESKRLHPERTDAEHRTYAGHKAAMAFRKIQNASSAMDQTTAQLTVKGQGSAGLLLFGSDTIRTLGRLRQAKRDGQLTKFLTAEALNIATGTAMKKGFQAALVAAGASMAGNDDEWERYKKQDLALQAWSRAYLRDAFGSTVPVVGGYVVPAAERGYALATGTPQPRTFKEFEPAMLRLATDVGDLFNDVARGGEASAKGDSQRAAKAYQDALLAGGALALTAVGAPIKPAVDYIATARRAGSAEVNTGKEAKLAGDAIRGGKADDAAFYIGRMLRARDENKPLYQRRDEVVRLLARQGPRGNLSGQEWSEKVNAEPDLAKRVEMRAAQRDWEKLVGDAVRQAARAAAGRRGEGVSSSN